MNYFSEGKWYIITRYYDWIPDGCFYEQRIRNLHQVEYAKCLCATETKGLFSVENLKSPLGNNERMWFPKENCILYNGKMKKKYIFWGELVPDL